jgi:hypothetical protein
MQVKLIFPPQWTPTQPYLGIACLSAYLKEEGIDCQQIDLNAMFYDHILHKPFIEENMHILEEKFAELEKKKRLRKKEKQEYRKIAPYSAVADYILDHFEESIRFIKSRKALSDIDAYVFHLGVINHALRIYSLGQDSIDISLSNMTVPVNVRKSSDILRGIRRDSTLKAIYETALLDKVTAGNPEICGISITGISQILPALLLSYCIHQKDPSIRVIMGGSILTRITNSVSALNNILKFCDGIIAKEGEIGLSKYCKGYKNEEIPGLVYKKKKKIVINNAEYIKNLDDLPTPDFEELDFSLYFSPEKVLPVYATRACYWGKCAFCDHGFGYHKGYRVRSPERVVEDLSYLSKRWTQYFTFSDESIQPRHLHQISREIVRTSLDVRWIANVRGEGKLTKEICDAMYEAGGRVLLFGFESGSQKTLDAMRKGIRIETFKRDLECSSLSHIWNHGFLFFGFPGETPRDALQTIDFVRHNTDILHSVGDAVFSLGTHSQIANETALFEIQSIEQTGGEDMAIWLDYTVKSGISNIQAQNISGNFEKRLKDIYPYQSFTGRTGREHLLLFLDEYGKEAITEMSKEEAQEVSTEEIKTPNLSDSIRVGKFKYDFMEKLAKMNRFSLKKKDTYVIFNLFDEKLLEISETAYFILNLCDGTHTVEDIARALSETYDQPFDEVSGHVAAFISQMCRKGIVFSA